ncbi:LOW QUALITY PROTEIN: uncharacterized protein LOC143177352 [Calliopsis andreniformis]|uniref:LOW QUALITY PROTEIN: uncharacterized protein LOC143177352 n=1 Tax=Calliopsis andreniformis TaxID=337506 RepID=UPI003FCDA8CC
MLSASRGHALRHADEAISSTKNILTLIMNLESSTTPGWYVYVGGGSRLFFTANLRRGRAPRREKAPRGGLRKGTRRNKRTLKRGTSRRKKKKAVLVTHDNVRRRHDG